MARSARDIPAIDPTPIFEAFRGSYGTELLTVAVAHLKVFDRLADRHLGSLELRESLGLEERPGVVLFCALKAMGLIVEVDDQLELTPIAKEHLAPEGEFRVADYVGLAAESPGVLEMLERLRTNRPAGIDEKKGAAFIYREGLDSAMEEEAGARRLTLALAGRAKNVAPHLARAAPLTTGTLLDVGGGTGIYSIAYLQSAPALHAIVFDRPEVLKVCAEFAAEYGVEDRLELRAGDMFRDELPPSDTVLLSNILHDWDVPECRRLLQRCFDILPRGGQLIIHDVFLNDALDGPLPIALYSAALFSLTEGRAYSAREYSNWMTECGFDVAPVIPTLVHCGALVGRKI